MPSVSASASFRLFVYSRLPPFLPHSLHLHYVPRHTPPRIQVAYGSFHFHRQTGGLVALHSLKNPRAPERVFALPSGAMAVAFHPSRPSLLAVGRYDGGVAVFDARTGSDAGVDTRAAPLYEAPAGAGGHSDAVWQVAWLEDEARQALQFVSASSDGDVLLWTVAHGALTSERLMRLTAPAGAGAGEAGAPAGAHDAAAAAAGGAPAASAAAAPGGGRRVVGGACLEFNWVRQEHGMARQEQNTAYSSSSSNHATAPATHKHTKTHPLAPFAILSNKPNAPRKAPGRDHEYLVGTDAGDIARCSRAYASEYVAVHRGHAMPVYAARWNRLHPSVFLSASADWTLRVWDARAAAGAGAALSFDLGAAAGDAAWAPASATLLAAVADDGRCHVFDLAASRLAPLCSQRVTRSGRPTRVAFSPRHPVLLVGDSKGNVTCLKLSPNLRGRAAGTSGGGAGGGSGSGSGGGAGTSASASSAAARSGGGGGDPAAAAAPATGGAGDAAAAARARFEAAERQRLEAILAIATKGRGGSSG